MDRTHVALIALTIALAAVLIAIPLTADKLPANVASHFGVAGNADGWMPRRSYLQGMTAVTLGMTAFIVAVFFVQRFVPAAALNLPNRDYWLAPDRRRETDNAIFSAGLWLATLQAGFLLGVHLLVVQANAVQPPQLSSGIWALLALFLLGMVGWGIGFFLRFRRLG